MAKAKTKSVKQESNLDTLMKQIKKAGAQGTYCHSEDASELEKQGLIEVNYGITDTEGRVAVRLIQNQTEEVKKEVKQMSGFQIVKGVELPQISARGRAHSVYPFDDMEVGDSFFVAATEDRPNPTKSLASTVTSANARYAEEVPGETRVNRKGVTVAATRLTRKYVIRPVKDGAPWGFPGVPGAAIGRNA